MTENEVRWHFVEAKPPPILMNKNIKKIYWWTVLVLWFVAMVIGFTCLVIEQDRLSKASAGSDAEIAMLKGQVNECREISNKFNVFSHDVAQIGSEPYDAKANNCYDHSKAMVKALADDGIQSSIMVDEGRNHAWVAVWIEATTGQFMTPDTPYRVVEVRDQKLNVICLK